MTDEPLASKLVTIVMPIDKAVAVRACLDHPASDDPELALAYQYIDDAILAVDAGEKDVEFLMAGLWTWCDRFPSRALAEQYVSRKANPNEYRIVAASDETVQ